MKRLILAAVIVAAFGAQQAAAEPRGPVRSTLVSSAEKCYLGVYPKAKAQFGYEVVGRNVVRTGMTNKRAATQQEIRESCDRMKGWLNPPEVAPASVSTGAPVGGHLAAIAQCESGGDPSAIGGGGMFRGKYQFMQSTWEAVGGSGDPALAPEAEQDKRAAMLYAQSGPGQWPVCGS